MTDHTITYICDKCNGTGFASPDNGMSISICPKCDGEKKLDWIENILGKRKKKVVKHKPPGVYVKEIDLSEYVPAFPNYDYAFTSDENLVAGDLVSVNRDGSITKTIKKDSMIIGVVKSYNYTSKEALVQINGVT